MTEAIRIQECCYLSTPKHIHSFIGRFIYIYTAKGDLRLMPDLLIFTSKKKSFEISLDLITDISSGHYSRWAKPCRLDYIAITYCCCGKDETVLLTPAKSWLVPVWKTNKIVASWMKLLKDSIRKQ